MPYIFFASISAQTKQKGRKTNELILYGGVMYSDYFAVLKAASNDVSETYLT